MYGGIALFSLLQQSYFLYWRDARALERFNRNDTVAANVSGRAVGRGFSTVPLSVNFFGSFISIAAGLSLITLLRSKESKEITRNVVDSMIMPEEKRVMKELEEHGGELTQSEVVKMTGLSKVKIHRVIKRLEALGIVIKYPYGITNKIKLQKRMKEEE